LFSSLLPFFGESPSFVNFSLKILADFLLVHFFV
jgi:hypothetical protein